MFSGSQKTKVDVTSPTKDDASKPDDNDQIKSNSAASSLRVSDCLVVFWLIVMYRDKILQSWIH